HQAPDVVVEGKPSPEAAVGLADGCVERSFLEVVDVRAVVAGVVHRGIAQAHQRGEELLRLRALDDAAEACVLARYTDARVQHYGRQEPGLALGESLLCDGLNTFVERHRNSSA